MIWKLLAKLGIEKLPVTEDCAACSGSGFSKPGTGYDDVCTECVAGQALIEYRWQWSMANRVSTFLSWAAGWRYVPNIEVCGWCSGTGVLSSKEFARRVAPSLSGVLHVIPVSNGQARCPNCVAGRCMNGCRWAWTAWGLWR